MIPAIMKGGRSFKGAAAYYLHDKGAETTGRVAWVETVNLLTADPDKAWRAMSYTAMNQDALKQAAGIKATGRKLSTPVFSYSLSWHPTEAPTREDMVAAARETLSVLELDGHQAMIVCHDDEPHFHVHVLVNRVSPVDGRAATLSQSQRKLSAWALDYERKRGKVFAEKRAENEEKRSRGEQTHDPRVSRDAFEAKAANPSLSAEFMRAQWKQRAGALMRKQRAMEKSHRDRFAERDRTYKAGREQIVATARVVVAQQREEVSAIFKPQWADLFKKQRRERRLFDQAERTLLGTIRNMVLAVRERGLTIETAPGGLLSAVFEVASTNNRRRLFEAMLERQKKELASVQGKEVQRRAELVKVARDGELDKLREAFIDGQSRLRGEVADEVAAMKEEWKAFNAERRRAYDRIADRKGRNEAMREAFGRGRGNGLARERDRRREPPRGPGS